MLLQLRRVRSVFERTNAIAECSFVVRSTEDRTLLLKTFETLIINCRIPLLVSQSGYNKKHHEPGGKAMDRKILVAFFSRAGENYCNGKLVSLSVGNTELTAGKIAAMTGAELFKIEPLRMYADNYRACTEEAKQELQSNARPGLKQYLDSLDPYHTIILAYPNWWNTMPMPVWTFLEHYDFSGKEILPLCTHEGSALGRSVSDIRKLCPGAEVEAGLAIRGGNVEQADDQIRKWLEGAGLL